MKTAVSIPDKIFETAESMASELGTSRSQLYALALANFIQEHRNDNITAALNKIYGSSDSSVEVGIKTLQARSIPREKW
ncbi:MAG: ChpI protein [Candidatus Saccharimonadales bacterium]